MRKATLQSLCSILHRSALLASILEDRVHYIFQRCVQVEGTPRPELVREVDLGPFKHKVDDGQVLRKLAYALVSDLLARFADQVGDPLHDYARSVHHGTLAVACKSSRNLLSSRDDSIHPVLIAIG